MLKRISRTTILTLLIFGALGLIAQPANAVYNGYAGSSTRFSWLATIKLNGKFLCGGSLIRSDVVLTAAHCVQDPGVYTVAFRWKTGSEYTVGLRKAPIANARYRVRSPLADDIAILLLDRRVGEPVVPMADEPSIGTRTTALGFGCADRPTRNYTSCRTLPSRLQGMSAQVFSDNRCSGLDGPTQLCINGDSSSLNHGDSGGPVLVQRGTTWYLVGVTSALGNSTFWFFDFQPPYFNNITSVQAERQWINQRLAENPFPTAPPVNRLSITSYDRMQPGAPHNGFFLSAWQGFVARSNRLTYLGVTVGNPRLPAGQPVAANVAIRLCTDPGCGRVLAQVSPQIVNYGNSAADIGDVAVMPGATYYIVWYQPAVAAGSTWVTYWWAGGSRVTQSDQLQAVVKGYNA
jgi:hypothetical protein